MQVSAKHLRLGAIAAALLTILTFLLLQKVPVDLKLGPRFISVIGTFVFAIWGSWALLEQNALIWHHEDTESLSLTWFLGFASMFVSSALYGAASDGAMLLFQGFIRVIFYVPILIGLWRFGKKPAAWEVAVGVCLVVGLGLNAAYLKYAAWFYIVFSFIGVGTAATQPFQIRRDGPGKLSLKLCAIYLASTCFWTIYGLCFRRWAVWVPSFGFGLVYGVVVHQLDGYTVARTKFAALFQRSH